MPDTVNIHALMQALPSSGLEPQPLAILKGLTGNGQTEDWRDSVTLLEPPASHRTPFVEPVELLEKLLRHQGVPQPESKAQAEAAAIALQAEWPQAHWVWFYAFSEEPRQPCLPLQDVLDWLRSEQVKNPKRQTPTWRQALADTPHDVLSFLDKAIDVTINTPLLYDNESKTWRFSICNHPMLPQPKHMMEFVCEAPWFDKTWIETMFDADNPFMQWRKSMQEVAQTLQTALGEPVYYFADLDCDYRDDDVHRFLVLHWLCCHKPDSPYVRYLLQASGAPDVEALKAALIDPASYTQPFKMWDTSFKWDALCLTLHYPPTHHGQSVGVAFAAYEARRAAMRLLPQFMGAHAVIVAPAQDTSQTWHEATRYSAGYTAFYMHEAFDPVFALAQMDCLCVVVDALPVHQNEALHLPEPLEDLIYLAQQWSLPVRLYASDDLAHPRGAETVSLSAAHTRAQARQAHSRAYTRALREIRVEAEFCASGLWAEGGMLSFRHLDLPPALIRRIVAWQNAHDEHNNPHTRTQADEAWWHAHAQEEEAIAHALQAAVGGQTQVSVYRQGRWLPISELPPQPDKEA